MLSPGSEQVTGHTAARAPDVSVVIPTRDKASRLRMTLACLAGQAGGHRVEVVVVNDGSTDDTRAVLEEAARQLSLVVVAGDGRGRARARNLGARRGRADYLIFLDDDVLVGEEFVAAHLAAAGEGRFIHGRLRELSGAERIVADLHAAPPARIRATRDSLHRDGTVAGYRGCRLFANALERAVEAMAAGGLEDVAPWLGCVGANVAMGRADFERAGGMDEGFGERWGCEDLEFGRRLWQGGVRREIAAPALGVHLTHNRPLRWAEHQGNLDRFRQLHSDPAVDHLGLLLGPHGDPEAYAAAVRTALTVGRGSG